MHRTEFEPLQISGSEVSRRLSKDGLMESYECAEDASDERVSGTAMSGTHELVNDGGSWVGDWAGEITPDGNHIMEGVLEGTGGHQGLVYEVRWEGVDEPYAVTGTIHAGR